MVESIANSFDCRGACSSLCFKGAMAVRESLATIVTAVALAVIAAVGIAVGIAVLGAPTGLVLSVVAGGVLLLALACKVIAVVCSKKKVAAAPEGRPLPKRILEAFDKEYPSSLSSAIRKLDLGCSDVSMILELAAQSNLTKEKVIHEGKGFLKARLGCLSNEEFSKLVQECNGRTLSGVEEVLAKNFPAYWIRAFTPSSSFSSMWGFFHGLGDSSLFDERALAFILLYGVENIQSPGIDFESKYRNALECIRDAFLLYNNEKNSGKLPSYCSVLFEGLTITESYLHISFPKKILKGLIGLKDLSPRQEKMLKDLDVRRLQKLNRLGNVTDGFSLLFLALAVHRMFDVSGALYSEGLALMTWEELERAVDDLTIAADRDRAAFYKQHGIALRW